MYTYPSFTIPGITDNVFPPNMFTCAKKIVTNALSCKRVGHSTGRDPVLLLAAIVGQMVKTPLQRTVSQHITELQHSDRDEGSHVPWRLVIV